MTTYRVLGLEEITAALQAFPDELVKKSLSKALMKGAVLIRDECRRRAPVGPTGKLEGSIIAFRDKRPELRGSQAHQRGRRFHRPATRQWPQLASDGDAVS